MARNAELSWSVAIDVLAAGIGQGEERFFSLLEQNIEDAAGKMTSYAQSNHPWTNRTGDAERTFQVRTENGGLRIVLAHGVFYGKYLELKNGGQYGVIPAVMQYARAPVRDAIQDALDNAWQ